MLDLSPVSEICLVPLALFFHTKAYPPANDIYREGFYASFLVAAVLEAIQNPKLELDLTPLSQKIILPLLTAGFSTLSIIFWYNLSPQLPEAVVIDSA